MYTIKTLRLLFTLFIFTIFFSFTPKVDAITVVDGDITGNTTWIQSQSPYIIQHSINVDTGVTLTIEPGVVVKFEQDASLFVEGTMSALGTELIPIYFTSNFDDEVGGNTDDGEFCYENIDGGGNDLGQVCEGYDTGDPVAGDWNGIYFINSVGSNFKNVSFRYTDDTFILQSSSANFENFNINDGVSGLNAYADSHVEVLGGVIENLQKDAFWIFNDSSLILENVTILNIFGGLDNSINIYNNSSATITDVNLTCTNDGLSVHDNSILDLNGGSVSCGHDGILIFNEANATIDNVKISGATDVGILAFDNLAPNSIIITKSEITGNENGFVVFNTNISVNQNNIHGNIANGVFAFTPLAPNQFDFTNNYWGDPSGPQHVTNPSGLGDIVSDNVLFTPWLTYDPLVERTPVVLIPGITGSYLFKQYGDNLEIWPDIPNLILSITDSFLNDLDFNINGIEKSIFPIIVGDIIREAGGKDIFDGLIDEFTSNGYIENTDLFVFPYDWRKSNIENAILLKNKIDTVLEQTGDLKVDIVAHSMGGLLAKKYIADEGGNKINKLVFLGTPHLGAPKAFKALMYGDDMGIKVGPVHIFSTIREKFISQNMPSIYELLPSEKYVTENGSYVKNSLDENNILNLDYNQTKDFMIEKGRNSLMFPFAETLHDSIDNLDLSGVQTYNFVGCGSKTIGKITAKMKRSWTSLGLHKVEDFDLKYVNGDETVPLSSAQAITANSLYFVKNSSHGTLSSVDGLKQDVLSILTGATLSNSDNILSDASTCNVSGKVVSAHSPVELHIYDELGNHTGLDANGDVENKISGVQYDIVNGEKFAFLPDGVNYKITTKATDTGGYNFNIEDENASDTITGTYNWTLIPLHTLQTNSEIWVGPSYPSSNYVVKVDQDGDSIFESTFPESFDGTSEAELATAPIVIKSSSSGFLRTNQSNSVSVSEVIGRIQNTEKVENNIENIKEEMEKEKIEPLNKKVDKVATVKNVPKNKEQAIIDLTASAGNSGKKVWPSVAIGGFAFMLLVKRFIKV